jgi:carbon monoxide dehydrogenase subunit G
MTNISVSRTVAAPAGAVWSILIDLDGLVDTISAVQSIEVLSGDEPFGVGTKWRETRTLFGKKATEVMRVTDIDPGTSYVVEAESHGARYTTVMTVTATGDDTSEITIDFGAEPTGTLARIMGATIGKLFENATRKAFAHDLDDIAAASSL